MSTSAFFRLERFSTLRIQPFLQKNKCGLGRKLQLKSTGAIIYLTDTGKEGIFMQGQTELLLLVLNKIEVLDKLLQSLNQAGIKGATVIHSTGMAHAISKEDDVIFSSLRKMFTPDREENRTIFMVLDASKLQTAKEVIYSVVGDLSQPNTGILVALPLSYVDGVANL